jgi:hypothetical protein
MARYYNLTITRRIKVQDPLPDNCTVETLEDETSVEYPFDCEEIDGSVEATLEDAD